MKCSKYDVPLFGSYRGHLSFGEKVWGNELRLDLKSQYNFEAISFMLNKPKRIIIITVQNSFNQNGRKEKESDLLAIFD